MEDEDDEDEDTDKEFKFAKNQSALFHNDDPHPHAIFYLKNKTTYY